MNKLYYFDNLLIRLIYSIGTYYDALVEWIAHTVEFGISHCIWRISCLTRYIDF